MISIYILPFLFAIVVGLTSVDGTGKKLKMVHLVYRHGARSPTRFYPNDKTQEKDWPDGGGRLTQIGMNMEYNLGKFLKKRYVDDMNFIDQMYLHEQVYVRSSDVERCLQSAESQLAGLYPPTGYQIWNPKIPWQPVPVHTVPMNIDAILRPDDVHCPRRDEIWEKHKQTSEFKRKVKENEGLFKTLSNLSGMNISITNVMDITDSTICERTDRRIVPMWVNELWNETISIANYYFLSKYRGGVELGKMLGGTFLHKITDDMIKASEGVVDESLFKMNIFSGHDTSLMSLAAGLDIDIDVPTFSACIMVELYKTEKGFVVEMLLRDLHSLRPLQLKGCNVSCPLADFISLTKDRTANKEDYQKVCGIALQPSSSYMGLKFLVIAFSSMTVLFMSVIAYCLIKRVKLGYENKHYLHEGELLIPGET